jgi:uncharacterized membrane-anchored protein
VLIVIAIAGVLIAIGGGLLSYASEQIEYHPQNLDESLRQAVRRARANRPGDLKVAAVEVITGLFFIAWGLKLLGMVLPTTVVLLLVLLGVAVVALVIFLKRFLKRPRGKAALQAIWPPVRFALIALAVIFFGWMMLTVLLS